MVICSVCLEDAFIAATYRSASLVVSVVQFQASRYTRADQIIQLTSKSFSLPFPVVPLTAFKHMFRRLWGAAAQSFDNRTHLLLRVVNVVHAVWDIPSFVRLNVEHLRPGRRFGKGLRWGVAAVGHRPDHSL